MPSFNAAQQALLGTMSAALKQAFEDDDEQAVQTALQALPKGDKDALWKKITDVALWSPTKVWAKPIPKQGLAYTNMSGGDDELLEMSVEGSIGIGLINGEGGNTVVSSVEANGSADKAHVPVGAVVSEINGKSTEGMSKAEVVTMIRGIAGIKALKFRVKKSKQDKVAAAAAAVPTVPAAVAKASLPPAPRPSAPTGASNSSSKVALKSWQAGAMSTRPSSGGSSRFVVLLFVFALLGVAASLAATVLVPAGPPAPACELQGSKCVPANALTKKCKKVKKECVAVGSK